jgi:outer membrane lipoprotein-sorting protein
MKRFILMIIFFLIPFQVLGEEAGTDHSAAKDEIFARIKQASSQVRTLSGEFTQEKDLSILENAPVSKGRFYYQSPDCLRWEVYEPVAMGFIVKGDTGKRWRGKTGPAQSFNLKKEPVIQIIAGQVFAWARGDIERLTAGYEITVMGDAPVVLKLVPLSATEKRYLEYIRLLFSPTEDYVSAIEIHETGGDATKINFIDMTINKTLPEETF